MYSQEPPFFSVEHAIRWAFLALDKPIVKTSSLGSWRGKETAASVLTPQERHGQAAQVLALLEALPDLERAYLLVKHLPPRAAAPARSGKVFRKLTATGGAKARRGPVNRDRKAAQDTLAVWLTERTGERRVDAFRQLVAGYFGWGLRLGERHFARLARRRYQEAMALRRQAIIHLQVLEVGAESRLHYLLMRAGFVPGRVEWTGDFEKGEAQCV